MDDVSTLSLSRNVQGAPAKDNSTMEIWTAVSGMQKRFLAKEVPAKEISVLLKVLGGPRGMTACLRDPEMTRVVDMAAHHPVFKDAPASFFTEMAQGGSHLTPVSRLCMFWAMGVMS